MEKIRKLSAITRQSFSNFGEAGDIGAEYAIVGAMSESSQGAVYIFRKDEGGINNWGLVKKLIAPVPSIDGEFGKSESVNGDYVAIGATGDNTDASGLNFVSRSGSVFIYKSDIGGTENWGLVKKITSLQRTEASNFGYSLSLDGDLLAKLVVCVVYLLAGFSFQMSVGQLQISKIIIMKKSHLFFLTILLPTLLQAQSQPAENQKAAQQTVVNMFAKLAELDSVNIRNYCATDIVLYENGQIWNLDTLIRKGITPNIGTGFKRSNKFDFINTTIRGNTAWVTYSLYSDVEKGGRKTSIHWMETVDFG